MLGPSGELVAQNALAHAFYNGSFGVAAAGAGHDSAAAQMGSKPGEMGSKQMRFEEASGAAGLMQGKYIHIHRTSNAYPTYLLYQ